MYEIIRKKLQDIESREGVKIIFAAESGSRAWGFASPDSDYDVRFIYVRPRDFYLKLESTRDVLECQLDETFDIVGWDLQKALRLLYKSNPTIFEWSNSPIIYKTTPCFQQLKVLINQYFSCKSGLYHYLNTANSNYREYLKGESVRLKKYLYVIRPILACQWILDKGTPPPMLFSELMKEEMDKDIIPYVDKLLEVKVNSPEVTEGKRIDALNLYIEEQIPKIQRQIDNINKEEPRDWNKLNELFVNIINSDY